MNRALPLWLWLVGFFLCIPPQSALGLEVSEVPMPPEEGWIIDTTGVLSTHTIAAVDEIADKVYEAGAGELAVAVIPSTDGANHRQFATDLFNLWGVGDADKDNGVLIFVAINDRKAEIILGDGLDSPSTTRAAEKVMESRIVAHFKRSDPNSAVRAGAKGCARQIFGVEVSSQKARGKRTNPASMASSVGAPPRDGDSLGLVGGLAALLGLGGVGVSGGLWWKRRQRLKPRICACGTTMTCLSEAEEDEFLGDLEQTEEFLGTVDHDVWRCSSCGDIQTEGYRSLFSKYKPCVACGGRTSLTTTVVLTHATEYSEGLQEDSTHCMNCDYSTVSTRSIPVITSIDSTSYGGSSSSGFGGGSSSGGGASGSW